MWVHLGLEDKYCYIRSSYGIDGNHYEIYKDSCSIRTSIPVVLA